MKKNQNSQWTKLEKQYQLLLHSLTIVKSPVFYVSSGLILAMIFIFICVRQLGMANDNFMKMAFSFLGFLFVFLVFFVIFSLVSWFLANKLVTYLWQQYCEKIDDLLLGIFERENIRKQRLQPTSKKYAKLFIQLAIDESYWYNADILIFSSPKKRSLFKQLLVYDFFKQGIQAYLEGKYQFEVVYSYAAEKSFYAAVKPKKKKYQTKKENLR
ncbi:hypothetical protein M2139_000596 [Enterococcus sp. PF1-24]|uniref:hypothetical protein n=1 Tax=unclassified Enterococcus TaxID=2608891 RepID=UPI002475C019|nr:MULTISPECIES: hypothetical protein [unclassified Enterococcus]MDH6363759.1 hypothetical protein [Enterococcus sp. PFB1-1]MDH6400715.1 hypothetical protein [Enterococcus sp. PF1-24]